MYLKRKMLFCILKPLKDIKCMLYLNKLKFTIFVFSKYIIYFVPVKLFIRLLISSTNLLAKPS